MLHGVCGCVCGVWWSVVVCVEEGGGHSVVEKRGDSKNVDMVMGAVSIWFAACPHDVHLSNSMVCPCTTKISDTREERVCFPAVLLPHPMPPGSYQYVHKIYIPYYSYTYLHIYILILYSFFLKKLIFF